MIRMGLMIESEESSHVKIAMLLNGVKITGPCGIQVRVSELVEFIRHINPEGIQVDREMVSDYVVERLRTFQNTRFV